MKCQDQLANIFTKALPRDNMLHIALKGLREELREHYADY